jgi:hypothetical protein
MRVWKILLIALVIIIAAVVTLWWTCAFCFDSEGFTTYTGFTFFMPITKECVIYSNGNGEFAFSSRQNRPILIDTVLIEDQVGGVSCNLTSKDLSSHQVNPGENFKISLKNGCVKTTTSGDAYSQKITLYYSVMTDSSQEPKVDQGLIRGKVD